MLKRIAKSTHVPEPDVRRRGIPLAIWRNGRTVFILPTEARALRETPPPYKHEGQTSWPRPQVDPSPVLRFNELAVNAATPKRSEEKLQQVILYFLEHINNVHLGRTKLMKLLYYVDFDHCEAHGVPVTGATYRKLPHGPYPDHVEELIAQMEKDGLVREVKVDHQGYTQHRLLTLNAKFDPAKFSGTELQALERVAADWADATAAQIEAATHREAPWAGTQAGKKIDYEMAEYRRAIGFEPLDDALATSKELADYVAALA